MKFQKGQAIIYTTLTGKQYSGIVMHRKCDFPNNYIDTDFEHGGFDYLIQIVKDMKEEKVFVNENDLA
ncbi:hypothetical protein [Zobellia barbeyronii]|uniref:Uncharacterized protein n=1 Tax=Zobellia barbeyronii TaxID=2748009 RepID=A0ABS5WK04_9FLAO|nr:hypothetical protein [Zobellia barbeyronii]MBT2163514.1 hypothetical protein [Zobellia barbeyronii]